MYDCLANIYDKFSDDIDYDTWTDKIESALKTYAKTPVKSVTDLACGTGNITYRLAKRGYFVTGIDISQEMLQRASEKIREQGVRVNFVCQDISDFKIHKTCDAIVCACDGVNYLLEDDDIKGFFNSCKKALNPGGVLVFDISSENKLKNTLGTNGYFDIRDDACMIWQNNIEGRQVALDLTMFIEDGSGKYIRQEETQRQRIYSVEDIKLAASDFNIVRAENFAVDYDKKDERIQFVCVLKEEKI